jgi:hypothetical protein
LNSGEKIGGRKKWRQKKIIFCVSHNIFSKKNYDFLFKIVILTFSRELKKRKKEKKLKNLDML